MARTKFFGFSRLEIEQILSFEWGDHRPTVYSRTGMRNIRSARVRLEHALGLNRATRQEIAARMATYFSEPTSTPERAPLGIPDEKPKPISKPVFEKTVKPEGKTFAQSMTLHFRELWKFETIHVLYIQCRDTVTFTAMGDTEGNVPFPTVEDFVKVVLRHIGIPQRNVLRAGGFVGREGKVFLTMEVPCPRTSSVNCIRSLYGLAPHDIAAPRTYAKGVTTKEDAPMSKQVPDTAPYGAVPAKPKTKERVSKTRQAKEPQATASVKRSANGIWMVDVGKGFKFAKEDNPFVKAFLKRVNEAGAKIDESSVEKGFTGEKNGNFFWEGKPVTPAEYCANYRAYMASV